MKIGYRLAILRKKAGYTQPEVANILEISNGSIGHWETDSREPSYAMLDKLCALYNTSVSDLFSDNFDVKFNNKNPNFLDRVILELKSEQLLDSHKDKFDDYSIQAKEILKAALVTHIKTILKD